MTETVQTPYVRLREGRAEKLGLRASGAIRYAVLADPDRRRVFITLTHNEGGGQFSKEIVPLRDIEDALGDIAADASFASRALGSAFVGKSVCNAGFLAAVLRAEGLLMPAPTAKHQLVRCGDWAQWQADLLELDGEPILLPPLAATPASTAPAAATPATPTPSGAGRKGRRGGNRLVSVGLPAGDDDADHS